MEAAWCWSNWFSPEFKSLFLFCQLTQLVLVCSVDTKSVILSADSVINVWLIFVLFHPVVDKIFFLGGWENSGLEMPFSLFLLEGHFQGKIGEEKFFPENVFWHLRIILRGTFIFHTLGGWGVWGQESVFYFFKGSLTFSETVVGL